MIDFDWIMIIMIDFYWVKIIMIDFYWIKIMMIEFAWIKLTLPKFVFLPAVEILGGLGGGSQPLAGMALGLKKGGQSRQNFYESFPPSLPLFSVCYITAISLFVQPGHLVME